MDKKRIVNASYEILKIKYKNLITDKEKFEIKSIISNSNEISDLLREYKIDNSIQPFDPKPFE